MSPKNADNPDGFAAPSQYLHENTETLLEFDHGGWLQIATDPDIQHGTVDIRRPCPLHEGVCGS